MADALRIAFVGAGQVNFGGGEGPWDHASRLERLGGVQVVGVADPVPGRASRCLAARAGPVFGDAAAFACPDRMLAETRPDAVWIGVPPHAHGRSEPPLDLELRCARAGCALFIEKPLSSAPPEDVRPLASALAATGVAVSVGYMFRYARAAAYLQDVLQAHGGRIHAFLARYNCAYSEIRKAEWWDVKATGGPIVEQATHFIDLARFLAGEVEHASIQARSIPGAGHDLSPLADVPRNTDGEPLEAGVPDGRRVPRVTLAQWRFASGALGSLQHGALLHGATYASEIEIWSDGLRIVWSDPYGASTVHVRRPGGETIEERSFPDDDPYLAENRAFLEALRTGDTTRIRSAYVDALRTHELAWAITRAARA